MAVTPGAGYQVDPNNSNRVIPIDSSAQAQGLGTYSTATPAAQSPTSPIPQPSTPANTSLANANRGFQESVGGAPGTPVQGIPLNQQPAQTQYPAQQPATPTQTQQPQESQPSATQTAASNAAIPNTNLQPGSQGQDVQNLQNYLVQMGYLTPEQVATGPGIYGPQTTAAVAKLQQSLGIQAGNASGFYGPQTQQALAQKYQGAYNAVKDTQSPDQMSAAASQMSDLFKAQDAATQNPVFNSLAVSMAPIMKSLSQVLTNINNPALTATSLQDEYNQLRDQYNLPDMQASLLNMQNIMNGSEQDIRDEVAKTGGFATESQIQAMAASRSKVILKQYNALSTQYNAAQQNVQSMLQFASQDRSYQLQQQQATASVTESMASIQNQMMQMGLTMQSQARQAAQYNISQTGYQNFAATLQGNPEMQSYYENVLGLAPGTFSSPTALSSLDTYKEQQLQMTNLLRNVQLYNAGLSTGGITDLTGGTSTGQYGTATSTISQITGLDPNTPLSQVDPNSLVSAIIQNEGSSPAGVVNNPGNIKYVGLPGQINSGVKAQDGGTFASYATPEAGQQAIATNIQNAAKGNPNLTLGSFVDRYTNTAPSSAMTAPLSISTPESNAAVNGAGSLALYTGGLISPQDSPVGTNTTKAITAVTGLTPDEFNYLTKGQSALTRMPYGQQRQVKANVDAFLTKNNVDLSTFQSQYSAYNDTLQKNIGRFNNTQIAEGEVLGTLKNLDPAAVKAGLGNVNIANVAKVMAGEQVNDPSAYEYVFYYNDLINSLGYFYAAQQGKNSADIPDKTEAATVIKAGLSSGGAAGLQQAVQSTTLKMKNVLADAVDNSQQNVWNLFGVGSKYQPAGVKGALSNSDFVAMALKDNNISNYNSLISKVPVGKIAVVDNSTEEILAIDPGAFSSSKYTKL